MNQSATEVTEENSSSTAAVSGESTSGDNSDKKTGRNTGLIIVLTLAALGCFMVFLIYLVMGGNHSGVEFSPDDFTRRSFSYNKMPIFGYYIGGGIEFEDATDEVSAQLISNKLIKVRTTQPKAWDLVYSNRGDQKARNFDANILCQYLDKPDIEGGSYWAKWNTNHPAAAKLFWPKVAMLARNGVYLGTPDLFRLAMGLNDNSNSGLENGFYKQLDELVAKQFLIEAKSHSLVDEHEKAIEMLTLSIENSPTKEAYLERAASLDATGKSSQAQRDRLEASRLSD